MAGYLSVSWLSTQRIAAAKAGTERQMGDFDGRIILVTGSATGLGAAIAVGAAKRGAKAVILNYSKSRTEAEATAEAVRQAGAEAEIVQGDVAEDADCRSIADAAARFGRLDALVNNAGITKHVQNHAKLDALSKEDFLNLYAVNTVGPFQMLRACRPLLEAAERPSVLMTSSIAAVTGVGSSVAYAASKGALNTMVLSLARALAPKIRVNAICPGYIDTRWFSSVFGEEKAARVRENVAQSVPLQVASQPEDIADAALFFISDAARHVTGETLLVDGGMHLGFAPTRAR
jgi:3-oxoacyl-[acyl-carrier protein] reductase